MKYIALFLIHTYRLIASPFKTGVCRFHPTCSEYALDAFTHYNSFKALWLTIKRLIRCQPLCTGGYDPLPIHTHITSSSLPQEKL